MRATGAPSTTQLSRSLKPGTRIHEEVADWLNGVVDEDRVFLWVHYYDTHSPYRLTSYAAEKLASYEGHFKDGASIELLFSLNDNEAATEADWNAINTLDDQVDVGQRDEGQVWPRYE